MASVILLYHKSYDLRTTTSAVVVVVDNILGKELASRPIAATAAADAAGAAVDDKELVGETSPMDHDAEVDDDAVDPIASFVQPYSILLPSSTLVRMKTKLLGANKKTQAWITFRTTRHVQSTMTTSSHSLVYKPTVAMILQQRTVKIPRNYSRGCHHRRHVVRMIWNLKTFYHSSQ